MRLDRLKTLAEAATPGPWQWETVPRGDGWGHLGPRLVQTGRREQSDDDDGEGEVVGSFGHDAWGINVAAVDAEFIAAANPDTVLRLVSILQDLAAADPVVDTDNYGNVCGLCDVASHATPHPHTEQCPWRRAVELTQEQP